MKTARIIPLVLLLLVPSATFAQTSRATNSSANRSWQSFWSQFSTAVKKKDRMAIKRLMSSESDFLTVGGIGSRNDYLQMFNDKSYWQDVQRFVDKGTVSYISERGRPARRTKDKYLTFEYIGGRWRFIGLMGD